MDVVYVYKNTPENDADELRYSLRSLQNLPHDRVFVIGEKPAWLQNAVYLPVAQTDTKARNVSRNLQTAMNHPDISDDFILMNDDFFIMKPVDAVPVWHWGPVKAVLERMYIRYDEESDYMRSMKALLDALVAKGLEEPVSYELHIPTVFNKHLLSQMYHKDFGPIYQIRSMYGNTFKVGGTYHDDVKIYKDSRSNSPEYTRGSEEYMRDQDFLSATGGAFATTRLNSLLKELFPDKSKFEIYTDNSVYN